MTEFHAYPNREKEHTVYYLKNARNLETIQISWDYLGDNRQKAHKIIMNELEDLCALWKAKTGEDYYPIPSGMDFHEYDLVKRKAPTTQRVIWTFDR